MSMTKRSIILMDFFFESFKNLKANKYPNLKIYMDPIIYHEILNHIKEKAKNTSKEITSLKKGFGIYQYLKVYLMS